MMATAAGQEYCPLVTGAVCPHYSGPKLWETTFKLLHSITSERVHVAAEVATLSTPSQQRHRLQLCSRIVTTTFLFYT